MQLVQQPSYRYVGCWIFLAIPLLLELENLKAGKINSLDKERGQVLSYSGGRNLTLERIFWLIILSMGSLVSFPYKSFDLIPVIVFFLFINWAITLLLRKAIASLKQNLTSGKN
jgi:hypothetical protein